MYFVLMLSILFMKWRQITAKNKFRDRNMMTRCVPMCMLGVGTLNNHMLNVLQAENRVLDFHIHERSDEMFYCKFYA